MHEIGDDQSDHVRAACNQAASDPVGPVIQLARAIYNAAPGLLADIAVAPQSLGNCHQRHTQILGDVFHSRTQTSLLFDSSICSSGGFGKVTAILIAWHS